MTAVRAVHDDMPATERITLPPARPEETDETFHQLGPIGRAATFLLGAAAVTHLLSTLSDWNTYHVVRDYLGGNPNVDDAQLNSADTIARLTSIPNVAVSVAAAVVFVLWLWRARLNSEVFCKADHRHSHGWVLGAWIVPGPNLFYPKHIVEDVWAASDKRTPPETEDLSKSKHSALVAAWWVCWVGAMLLDVVLRRVLMWMDPTVGSLRITALSGSVALVLTVMSAILATLVIRRITTMQNKRQWIAWWDLEEPQFAGRRLEPVRDTAVYEQKPMYAGVGAGAGESRYGAASYDEPSFADVPSYRDEPTYHEPAFDETKPAYTAASLRAVPDPKPSWSPSDPVSRYDDPAPQAGLPKLPSVPSVPEAESDKPAWTPFASVVEEWQHEDEEPATTQLPPTQTSTPTSTPTPTPTPTPSSGQSIWPVSAGDKPWLTDREPQGWPESPSRDYLNPAASIPSPPQPPLTLVPSPEPSYDDYRDKPAASSTSSSSDSPYSYDSYESYRSEFERSYGLNTSFDQPSKSDSPLDRPFEQSASDARYDQRPRDPQPPLEQPSRFGGPAGNEPGQDGGYNRPGGFDAGQQTPRFDQAPPAAQSRPAERPSRFRPVPPDSEPSQPAQGPGHRFNPAARRGTPAPEQRFEPAPRPEQAPRVDQAPRLDQAPRRDQAPSLPQAPRLDQAPVFGQPPRRDQAPSFDQPSSYGQAPRRDSGSSFDQAPQRSSGRGRTLEPPAPKPSEPETGPYESPYSSPYQPSYTNSDSDYTTSDLLRSFLSESSEPRVERPRRAAPQPEPPRDSSYGLPSYGYGDSYGSDTSYRTGGSHASQSDSGDYGLPPLPRDSFLEAEQDDPQDEPSLPRTHPRRRWSV